MDTLLAPVGATALLLRSATSIVESLTVLMPDVRDVPDEVLRLAYLDVQVNLRILDVIPSSGGAPGTDAQYFAYAESLRLASLLALVLQWRTRAPLDVGAVFARRKTWQRLADELDAPDLVALASKVVVAGEALRAIAKVPVDVRTRTRVRTRLRNLKSWMQMLEAALRTHPQIERLRSS